MRTPSPPSSPSAPLQPDPRRKLMRADWTDPSNPRDANGHVTDASQIAAAFTEYYKPLYAKKKTTPASMNAALRALRKGRRVLPPTAAKCDAPIAAEDVERICNHLPLGKSPGPDRLHLTEQVSAKDRDRFENLIAMHPDGSHALAPAFTRAIDAAANAAGVRQANNPAAQAANNP